MKKIGYYLFLLIFLGCASRESIENLQDCKKLKLGMNENEVIKKMGEPLSSRLYYSEHVGDTIKSLRFKYDVLAASTGIVVEININSNSVVFVNCDEEVIVE